MSTNRICEATRIFYGQYRSIITCRNCRQEKNHFTLFNSLPLLNTREGICKSITHLESMEYISDYACERCKKSTSIKKRNLIWKLPRVFLLQVPLKGMRQLDFDLSIQERWSGKTRKYTLKGLGCHHGNTPDSGHYYSFVNYTDWFSVNDESVCKVSPSTISEHVCNVYTILYEKLT